MRAEGAVGEHTLPGAHTGERPLVELEDVDFHYGPMQVLFGVSMHVPARRDARAPRDERRGQVDGAPRAVRPRPPSGGSILLEGRDVTTLSAERLAAVGVVQVPGGRAVFPDLTVLENLEVGSWLIRVPARAAARAHRGGPRDVPASARAWLESGRGARPAASSSSSRWPRRCACARGCCAWTSSPWGSRALCVGPARGDQGDPPRRSRPW